MSTFFDDDGLIEGDFAPDAAGGRFGGTNGRVPDVGRGRGAPAAFQLFSDAVPTSSATASATQSESASSSHFATDTLQHTWLHGGSAATELFLSRLNTDALQDAVRYRVYVETEGRYTIGRQSDAELALVMRSVLLQRGRNDDASSAVEQVKELNTLVLSWCVPRIISELDQYVHYREDVSRLPVPMRWGGLATSKGSRTLEMKNF